jgi:pterin-4a-carbinolamine dehydratase
MKLFEMFSPSSRQKLMEGIDHPEDLIIQQGSKGADRVIQDLAKLENDPSTITIKWDGLPALVWGRDKEGNFQLVDKHQFEKIAKGKAEFSTIRDYDEARGANRSSLWAKEEILRPVLEAATPQVRDQYWFGDFMYAGTPPVNDGKFVFKPNTVEYRVSQDGKLGDKISESQAGMAVHTFIPGLGSDDQPLVGLKGLDENAGVVFFVGEIKDKPVVKVDENVLAKAQSIVNEHREAVDKFLANLTEMKAKSVITAMSPFITRMLEEDDISGNIVPRFLEFLPERLTPAAAEKMLGKNKDGWLYQADGGGPGLLGVWSMWAAVTELKTSVKQLLDSQMQGSEVQALTDGVDAHEGYVFGAGKDKLKLIDRLGFTKANFARYRISDEEKKAKADMPMASFCFGRMNPPTLGHGLVMEKTVEVGGKDAYIFLSNSQGKDDPLDPSTKSQFIKKMYPKLASHIVDDYVQGPIYAANWLYDRGFRNITFVGGSDRLGKAPGSIEKLLNGWNSGPVRTTDAARGDSGREYVNLNFVSSGERDPDAPGVTGYSGTKARQAAADGDEAKFWEYTGASPNLKVGAVNLYQATRAGMGIKDEPAEEGMESMLDEGVSTKSSIKSILATADSITKVYSDLKTMAEKWVYNNGSLKGFHRNAAGVGKRWYDTFFWNKMENDLRILLQENPKAANKIKDFFNIERDEKGHVSFTTIARSLPRILNHVGEMLGDDDLKRFGAGWYRKQADYEDYLGRVEAEVNDEDDDFTPAPKQPKDNVVGRQNAAAEDVVNQILRSIDKKAAGEIRNAIAREPNKLQALQRELAKRNIKVGEDIQEGKFRKRDIEEKLISNEKLNDLKSKYIPDWEMLDHRILQAKYVAKDHRHAEDFVSYINKVSEEMDHFAEVTQDVAEVTVKTSTFDVKGLTILDFKLALKIDKFADRNEIEQVRMQGNFGMHEDIRKVKGGYRLVSKKSGRNLGTYPTRAGAEERERQVQYFKHAGESIKEAPIELDKDDPMDPMIYGHQGANPAKLKYRMARAAGQLKDLASRVDGASPEEWKRMAQQFEELKMNMEQIRYALEELGKIRKKGGIRSRGITI